MREHDWGGWCGGVGVAGNDLGAEGGRAVVEGLKHNSTLTELSLWGEFVSICPVLVWVFIWCGWWFVGGVGTNV